MYKRVLVPVSFEVGRNASEALKVADLIRATDSKITILHVLEHLPQYANDLLPKDHVSTARDIVAEKLAPLAEGLDNVEIAVVEGHSARTILDYAQEHEKDCIVMASHRPGMQDLFLGSTAARVVRQAQCAVHIIR